MAELRAARSATTVSGRSVDPHCRCLQAVREAPHLHRRRRPHRPTPDLAAVARERAVLSRRVQGLPDHITDSATLDQVAQLVLANRLPAWSARPPP